MLFNSESVAAVATGFQALFLQGVGKANVIWKDFCLYIESTHAREELVIPEGLGDLTEWIGPRDIDTPVRWTQVIINKDWQKTIAVPVNAYKDDNLGIYKAQAEMLGMAAAAHPDSLLSSAILGGFTAEGYDGVPFFSATHPLTEGATQSNIQAGALDATTFRAALVKLQSMKDYFGKSLRLKSMGLKLTLMVGPSNRATANSIVKLATTASGAGNPDFGEADVLVNEDFSGAYAGYWCILAGKGPIFPFIFQMREEPEIVTISSPDSEEVFKNKRILHGVQGRWNMGYAFYQLAVGSTGA